MKSARPPKGGGNGPKVISKFPKHNISNNRPFVQVSLADLLRRLAWLRQELNLWNEAAADRPMPQPRDFGLDIANLRPSDVHWRAAS